MYFGGIKMNFLDFMAQKAATDRKKIVLPESTDIRTIRATAMVCEKGFADIILLGKEKSIKELAGDLDISKATIIDHETSSDFARYSELFCEMRKSKGMTIEEASKIMANPLYYGAMMVHTGAAHGMVAGAINSTGNTLRPALQIIKTAKTAKLVSSVLVLVIPNCEYGHNGTFIFADCGLVENPSAEELAEIAIASAQTFKTLFNAEPVVAMLSYSTKGSAKENEYTGKVIEATRIAKERAPELMIDGELQADAAIVPMVGGFKAPDSGVAGKANVLIFPDINSGNIACKLVERLAKGENYGPITQGLNKPVNDLSRGCKAEDIVGAVAITAVQAQMV
jgi:phosphate acetyltransferase